MVEEVELDLEQSSMVEEAELHMKEHARKMTNRVGIWVASPPSSVSPSPSSCRHTYRSGARVATMDSAAPRVSHCLLPRAWIHPLVMGWSRRQQQGRCRDQQGH